jgi:hypothetical protein
MAEKRAFSYNVLMWYPQSFISHAFDVGVDMVGAGLAPAR